MYLKSQSLTISNREPTIRGKKLSVIVAYADLRGFAPWSLLAPTQQIMKVIEVIYDRVIQLAFFYKHSFHKFLGDGFLIVWEIEDFQSRADALRWALAASFEIHKRYWYTARQIDFSTPLGFGIGIACGDVMRVDPETFIQEFNEPDFVGYPMNSGARLQKLAGPFGTVLDRICSAEAETFPLKVLRADNDILKLELLNPTEKAISIAQKFTGLQSEDASEFRYVVWPYVQNRLWKVDGRI